MVFQHLTMMIYIYCKLTCFCVCSSSLQVAYDDYVTMTDGRAGHVRYIGHVDNIGQTDGVYVGLELDTQGETIAQERLSQLHLSHNSGSSFLVFLFMEMIFYLFQMIGSIYHMTSGSPSVRSPGWSIDGKGYFMFQQGVMKGLLKAAENVRVST